MWILYVVLYFAALKVLASVARLLALAPVTTGVPHAATTGLADRYTLVPSLLCWFAAILLRDETLFYLALGVTGTLIALKAVIVSYHVGAAAPVRLLYFLTCINLGAFYLSMFLIHLMDFYFRLAGQAGALIAAML